VAHGLLLREEGADTPDLDEEKSGRGVIEKVEGW